MKKVDFVLLLIIFISVILYISVRDYSNLFFREADSWIHVAKIKKYIFDASPFQSPIFLEDKNHYMPLSYFFVNLYSIYVNVEVVSGYGILGALLKVVSSLTLFLIALRFFGIKHKASSYTVLSLYFMAEPLYNFEFNPNIISIFLIYIIILVFSFRRTNIFLLLVFYLSILFTHIFFFAFSLLYGVLLIFFRIFRIDFIPQDFFPTSLPKLNPYFVLLVLIFFTSSFFSVNYFLMSEVGISTDKYIGLLGIGFLPIIFTRINGRNCRQSGFVLLSIYFLMYILYITKSWLLHSQYFTTFFINIIVLPGVIVLLYESFRKKYFIYSLFFIFLLIAPFFKANPVFVQQNTVKVQSWRESLLRELLPIKNELRNKVIFIDPGNFLNRYISTDFNVYLYAVNTNSQYGFTSRPFTTLPANELSKFSQFFHVSERMSLADNFLSSPNEYSYLDLLKYRVDYFIILNNPVPKYDLSKVKFFFEEELQNPPFFTTKNYTVYRNN